MWLEEYELDYFLPGEKELKKLAKKINEHSISINKYSKNISNISRNYTSLNECIDEYVKLITLDDDGLWVCDECNETVNPNKKTIFWY